MRHKKHSTNTRRSSNAAEMEEMVDILTATLPDDDSSEKTLDDNQPNTKKRGSYFNVLVKRAELLGQVHRDRDWVRKVEAQRFYVFSIIHFSASEREKVYVCNNEELAGYLLMHGLEGYQIRLESFESSDTREKPIVSAIYVPKSVGKDDFSIRFIFETNQGIYDFKGKVDMARLDIADFQLLPTQPESH